MPRPMGKIRILLSPGAIFDLEEASRVAHQLGDAEYADYLSARGRFSDSYDETVLGRKLKPGPLWNFAMALLKLNEVAPGTVELGIACKGGDDIAIPIYRNLDVSGMDIAYRISVPGKQIRMEDHDAFGTDLYLSRNEDDVQRTIDHGIAAAQINFPPFTSYESDQNRQIKLWVDGDAVAFGSSAEADYRKNGLEQWRKAEFNKVSSPIEPGPFTAFLSKISELNTMFEKGKEPFSLTLLTARGNESSTRALLAAQSLGIKLNGGSYCVSGTEKADVIKAHKPDIFFDDQQKNLQEVSKYCPTGWVCYPIGSPMQQYLAAQASLQPQRDPTPPNLGQ